MRARIITVGSELLLFGRRDTNGDWLSGRLARLGIDVVGRSIVADDEHEIAEAIEAARRGSALVIVTGGLGPTSDDVTREGLARSLGRPLQIDPAVRDAIANRLAARGYRTSGPAEKQARVPEGCEVIPNPIGSAPGVLHEGPPCWTILLPGVPGEMKMMFEHAVERLRSVVPSAPAPTARLLVAGLPESEVGEILGDIIGESGTARVTILASEGGVELHVLATVRDSSVAAREVTRIRSEIRRRLGAAVCAEGDGTLAGTVGGLLARRGASLAVSESCTGGLLGATITSEPGASAWFRGGFIVYSDALKQELLGVSAELLRECGAVSEPVALAMAQGARLRARASHALAITGIAGPEGGTEAKPVGLVHVALAAPEGESARLFHFSGDRQAIRMRSVTGALDLLRLALNEESS